jgi:hypothetical protein
MDFRIHHSPVSFKLQASKKDMPLTSFGGLLLLRQSLKTLGLMDLMKQFWLKQAGYADEIVIEALILLLASGGRSLSDWTYLAKENGFEKIFEKCPSVDVLERYLKRLSVSSPERPTGKGEVGYSFELSALHSVLIKKAWELAGSPKKLTLDIDTTIIDSNNQEALYTYEKEKGYQPMMGYCPELQMVIVHEFRDGNVSPAEGYDRMLARARHLFPKVKWTMRSDSAGYNLVLMDEMTERKFGYYITAKQCGTMLELMKRETVWVFLIKDGITTEQEVAEIAYIPTFPSQAVLELRRGKQRYIGIRKKRKQLDVVEGEWMYQVIATNDISSDLNEIVKRHRGRCGSIELTNSEIKSGCGMDKMPSNNFSVNAGWFSLGLMTHNILKLLQTHVLPESLRKVEIRTLRFRFLRMAALVVKKARQLVLRVSKHHPVFSMYEEAWENLRFLPVRD